MNPGPVVLDTINADMSIPKMVAFPNTYTCTRAINYMYGTLINKSWSLGGIPGETCMWLLMVQCF